VLEPTSDLEVSDVEPVIKPKSLYKYLCYVRAIDGYGATEKKKNTAAIEYDLDGVKVVPTVGMVFISLVDSLNETAPEIVFMIPEATSDGNQRVALQPSQSFEDAVEIMHETIGCVSVTRKPTLVYKMSLAVQKAPTINLCTVNDWNGLISDYTKKVKAKKDLSVMITVLPENISAYCPSFDVAQVGQYMFSLCAMNKKAPAIKKGAKKGKMTAIDLDNDDTDCDLEGDARIEDTEKKAMNELDVVYRMCVKCGTAHLCKIDRAGNHVHLTFSQCRAWAISLASSPAYCLTNIDFVSTGMRHPQSYEINPTRRWTLSNVSQQ
jgi:hypothetical protein